MTLKQTHLKITLNLIAKLIDIIREWLVLGNFIWVYQYGQKLMAEKCLNLVDQGF